MHNNESSDVQYDSVKKEVIVFFSGKRMVLPDRYDNEKDGLIAGKAFLRGLGWQG